MKQSLSALLLALGSLGLSQSAVSMPIIVDGNALALIFESIDLDGMDPADTDDQFFNNGEWAVSGSGGSLGRVIEDGSDPEPALALAALDAALNGGISFGLYQIGRPGGPSLELFNSGNAGPGSFLTFSLDEQFNVLINGQATGYALPGNKFGFYLSDGVNTWFSDFKKNPNMDAHVVVFEGNGEQIDLPGAPPGNFGANEYILAWELSPLAEGSREYDDFVVFVESIDKLPEPGSLLLTGLGLLGLGVVSRRRRRVD
jgi:hypothetical protein